MGVRRSQGTVKGKKNMKVTNKTTSIKEIYKKVTREMRKGNVHNAMKLLTNDMKSGVLPLIKKTLEQLEKKSILKDVMLIQRSCYQIKQKKFIRLSSILSTQKMLGKQFSERGVEQDHLDLMLTAGKGSLHRISLGIVQMIYAKLSQR